MVDHFFSQGRGTICNHETESHLGFLYHVLSFESPSSRIFFKMYVLVTEDLLCTTRNKAARAFGGKSYTPYPKSRETLLQTTGRWREFSATSVMNVISIILSSDKTEQYSHELLLYNCVNIYGNLCLMQPSYEIQEACGTAFPCFFSLR